MTLTEAEEVLKYAINVASMTTVERIVARDALAVFIQQINRSGDLLRTSQEEVQKLTNELHRVSNPPPPQTP